LVQVVMVMVVVVMVVVVVLMVMVMVMVMVVGDGPAQHVASRESSPFGRRPRVTFTLSCNTICENIKDDILINSKYEAKPIHLGPQHVIVFSNSEPDYSKCPEDRYDVHEIKESLYQEVIAGADSMEDHRNKRKKIGACVYTGTADDIRN